MHIVTLHGVCNGKLTWILHNSMTFSSKMGISCSGERVEAVAELHLVLTKLFHAVILGHHQTNCRVDEVT